MLHPAPQNEHVGEEARSRPRIPSSLICVILHGPMREHTLGVVRDIHDQGARIRPQIEALLIEGPVELEVDGRKFLADLAWKSDQEIGLHFVADFTQEQDEIVHHLRAKLAEMKRA